MTKALWFTLLLATSVYSQAGDRSLITAALDSVLSSESLEIIHAEAYANGMVEIIFGVSVNDYDHLRVVEKLRAHPEIKDVIARSSPRTFCNN